jgi:hypothetical protein
VEHPLGALQRPAHGAPIAQLELEPAAVEVGDRAVGGPLLHAERDVVAALDQQTRDVGADEARRTGDEDRGQAS